MISAETISNNVWPVTASIARDRGLIDDPRRVSGGPVWLTGWSRWSPCCRPASRWRQEQQDQRVAVT
jgi:hypothetical protein